MGKNKKLLECIKNHIDNCIIEIRSNNVIYEDWKELNIDWLNLECEDVEYIENLTCNSYIKVYLCGINSEENDVLKYFEDYVFRKMNLEVECVGDKFLIDNYMCPKCGSDIIAKYSDESCSNTECSYVFCY